MFTSLADTAHWDIEIFGSQIITMKIYESLITRDNVYTMDLFSQWITDWIGISQIRLVFNYSITVIHSRVYSLLQLFQSVFTRTSYELPLFKQYLALINDAYQRYQPVRQISWGVLQHQNPMAQTSADAAPSVAGPRSCGCMDSYMQIFIDIQNTVLRYLLRWFKIYVQKTNGNTYMYIFVHAYVCVRMHVCTCM